MDNLKNLTIQELIEYDKVHFVKTINILELILSPIKTGINSRFNPYDFEYNEYRNNLPIKKELDRSYNELLEKILIELDRLSLNQDAITITITLSEFLIPHAYLSLSNSFDKQNHNKIPLSIYLNFIDNTFNNGYFITTGKGVCRHVNSFICDILNKNGIETYLVGGTLQNPKNKRLKLKVNHAIIATIENEKYSLIDGYNNTYVISEGKDYFFNTGNSFYKLIPDFTIDENYMHSYKRLFYLLPYQEIINRDELNDRIRDIYKIMLSRGYHQFERFKQENLALYQRINTLTELEYNRTLLKELPKLLRIIKK